MEEGEEDEYEKIQKNLGAFLLCLNDSEQSEKHKILLDLEFWITKPGCPTS